MELLKFCKDLYKIPRSLTGDGVFKSLKYIQTYVPFKINKVKSGTKVFDWVIPDEWKIEDAFIASQEGHRIVDFRVNNLHVVGYSAPIDATLSFDELRSHLNVLPDIDKDGYVMKRWAKMIRKTSRPNLDRDGNS